MTWGDKRSTWGQVKSGARIAGAILVSLATFGLFAMSQKAITHPTERHSIVLGWTILICISLCMASTVRIWRVWFPFVPAFLGIRSLRLLFFIGSPGISPESAVGFPVLMFLMTYLSIRFSKKRHQMTIASQAGLFVAAICLLLATSQLLLNGTPHSILIFGGTGDIALLLAWWRSNKVRHNGMRHRSGPSPAHADAGLR